ncbi:hypothetical protein BC835DRAFT_1380865 [Cytidiella melzeri]|nr:hypothetical protein BC835DRAFT_1380865 [Cytidiella melzeri]
MPLHPRSGIVHYRRGRTIRLLTLLPYLSAWSPFAKRRCPGNHDLLPALVEKYSILFARDTAHGSLKWLIMADMAAVMDTKPNCQRSRRVL